MLRGLFERHWLYTWSNEYINGHDHLKIVRAISGDTDTQYHILSGMSFPRNQSCRLDFHKVVLCQRWRGVGRS